MKKVLSLVLAVVLALGMTTSAFAIDSNTASTSKADAKKGNIVKLAFFVPNATQDGGEFTQDYKFAESFKVGSGDSDNHRTKSLHEGIYETRNASDGIAAAVLLVEDSGTATATNPGSDGIYIDGGSQKYSLVTRTQVSRWDLGLSMTASTTFNAVSLQYSPKGTGKDLGLKGEEFRDAVEAGAAISIADNEYAIIRFEFKDSLVATGSKTSKDTFSVTIDGKKSSKGDLKLESKYENPNNNEISDSDESEIWADDISQRYLNIKTYLAKVKVYTEYDGIITTRLYERKYYVEMGNTPGTTAIAVMDKYGFEDYRKLSHINLPDSATVTFDLDDSLYVYAPAAGSSYDSVADSVQLVYLGKSNQQLPVATDYYFSPKEITIETKTPDTEPPAESSEPDTSAPSVSNPAGGPTEALPNNNYNPGTGC